MTIIKTAENFFAFVRKCFLKAKTKNRKEGNNNKERQRQKPEMRV